MYLSGHGIINRHGQQESEHQTSKSHQIKSLGVFGIDTDILRSYTKKVQGCDLFVEGNELSAECITALDNRDINLRNKPDLRRRTLDNAAAQ